MLLFILELNTTHCQAQVGVGAPHVGLADRTAPYGDLTLVSIGSDVAGIRQVGTGEGMVYRCDQEEETAVAVRRTLGVIPPTGEHGERANGQQVDAQNWPRNNDGIS